MATTSLAVTRLAPLSSFWLLSYSDSTSVTVESLKLPGEIVFAERDKKGGESY